MRGSLDEIPPALQEMEIKKAAKRGDKQVEKFACPIFFSVRLSELVCGTVFGHEQTAAVLAKQLVKLRQQRAKSHGLSSQIMATGHQMKVGLFSHGVLHSSNFVCMLIPGHHVTGVRIDM